MDMKHIVKIEPEVVTPQKTLLSVTMFDATILKGTIIGNNSIVSAGSVVKGHFPDNCIIQGNPATIVKTFSL